MSARPGGLHLPLRTRRDPRPEPTVERECLCCARRIDAGTMCAECVYAGCNEGGPCASTSARPSTGEELVDKIASLADAPPTFGPLVAAEPEPAEKIEATLKADAVARAKADLGALVFLLGDADPGRTLYLIESVANMTRSYLCRIELAGRRSGPPRRGLAR